MTGAPVADRDETHGVRGGCSPYGPSPPLAVLLPVAVLRDLACRPLRVVGSPTGRAHAGPTIRSSVRLGGCGWLFGVVRRSVRLGGCDRPGEACPALRGLPVGSGVRPARLRSVLLLCLSVVLVIRYPWSFDRPSAGSGWAPWRAVSTMRRGPPVLMTTFSKDFLRAPASAQWPREIPGSSRCPARSAASASGCSRVSRSLVRVR